MRMLVPLRSSARNDAGDNVDRRYAYDPVSYGPGEDPDAIGSEDEAWIAGALGLVSVIALSASFLWAHHWGPLADVIVGVWVVSTLAALILGVRNLGIRGRRRMLAMLALFCVSLSGLAVLYTRASRSPRGSTRSARAAADERRSTCRSTRRRNTG